jgi:hypothetical protein
MNVTRDVILDLAPAYIAGDASADTEALVRDFLAGDPALAAWMEEQRQSLAFGDAGLPPDLETRALARTRRRIVLQRWLFGVGCFVLALSLSIEFTARNGRIVEFHLLARDYPAAALGCWTVVALCWATYAWLRSRQWA